MTECGLLVKQISAQVIFLIVSLMFAPAFAATDQGESYQMQQQIERFIKLHDSLSSDTAIKELTEQVSSQFVYYHTHYNIELNKTAWLKALKIRKESTKTKNINTEVKSIQFGYNVAFVRQISRWQQRVGNKWYQRESDNITTVFEFNKGKISAVREYW